MRATAQDRTMGMLVGIDVNRVISLTFVIGSALAAIGGMLIASHISARSISSSVLLQASRPSLQLCLAA